MKQIKYQSKTLTIAAAAYAVETIIPDVITLDKAYDRLTGVAVHRIVDAAAANGNYKIGLSDDNGEIHEFAHISSWSTAKDDGTNPNERYKDMSREISGMGELQFKAKLPAQTTGAAIQVEFVFRIEKDLVRTN